MKQLKVNIPGKVYLSGEYAVVKGYYALILKTKLTLQVDIQDHDQFEIYSTKWDQSVVYDIENLNQYQAIWSNALMVAYAYILFKGKSVLTNRIYISSQLDQSNEHKWGLGSSGALVVGLIEALLRFHDIEFTSLELYKLSVLSQYDESAHQSFGDIATASFKSAIVYKKFTPFKTIPESFHTLNEHWDGLDIIPFEVTHLPLMVINTGFEANSNQLVQHFFNHLDKDMYTPLFNAIENYTLKIYEAIKALQPFHDDIFSLMTLYRELPYEVSSRIITPEIEYFTQVMSPFQESYKFSGAGGGDNVLLYVTEETLYKHIKSKLKPTHYILSDLIEGVKVYE